MSGTGRLPTPTAAAWDWQRRAACRERDPAVFFPAENEHDSAARLAAAQAICRACPVRAECREHALTVPERYGVWGGLSATQRQQLLVQQGRGALPRHASAG